MGCFGASSETLRSVLVIRTLQKIHGTCDSVENGRAISDVFPPGTYLGGSQIEQNFNSLVPRIEQLLKKTKSAAITTSEANYFKYKNLLPYEIERMADSLALSIITKALEGSDSSRGRVTSQSEETARKWRAAFADEEVLTSAIGDARLELEWYSRGRLVELSRELLNDLQR